MSWLVPLPGHGGPVRPSGDPQEPRPFAATCSERLFVLEGHRIMLGSVRSDDGLDTLGALRGARPRGRPTLSPLRSASADRSNGYEAAAREFMSRRTASRVGVTRVRTWARALPPAGTVLDLGCGHGVPITEVLVDEGLSVYGIDASPTLLAAFRARFPHRPTDCSAVEDSTLFDRRFDGVIAWGLMFLLLPQVQQKLMHRISEVLMPGGGLLFTSPRQACGWADNLTGRPSVSLGSDEYRRIAAQAGLTILEEFEDEGENHYYSARRLLDTSVPIPQVGEDDGLHG